MICVLLKYGDCYELEPVMGVNIRLDPIEYDSVGYSSYL